MFTLIMSVNGKKNSERCVRRCKKIAEVGAVNMVPAQKSSSEGVRSGRCGHVVGCGKEVAAALRLCMYICMCLCGCVCVCMYLTRSQACSLCRTTILHAADKRTHLQLIGVIQLNPIRLQCRRKKEKYK